MIVELSVTFISAIFFSAFCLLHLILTELFMNDASNVIYNLGCYYAEAVSGSFFPVIKCFLLAYSFLAKQDHEFSGPKFNAITMYSDKY